MTIEELKALKEYAVTMLHNHADEDDPLKMTFTEQDRQILGLIDAEIERQRIITTHRLAAELNFVATVVAESIRKYREDGEG
jgi:ribosomal protein S25